MALAVPPVDKISTPIAQSSLAKPASPVLSETLRMARFIEFIGLTKN
jgi:hypothetical protein